MASSFSAERNGRRERDYRPFAGTVTGCSTKPRRGSTSSFRAACNQPLIETLMTQHVHPERDGDVAPRQVRTLAVIGAGTMGTGIAITGLDAGLQVTLLEQDAAALERGATRIREHY